MMHLVPIWPKGCLLLLLRTTCVLVSNGTVSVYLTLLAHAQDAHGCILTRAHGVRELMWLIILIIICIIILLICREQLHRAWSHYAVLECGVQIQSQSTTCLEYQPNLKLTGKKKKVVLDTILLREDTCACICTHIIREGTDRGGYNCFLKWKNVNKHSLCMVSTCITKHTISLIQKHTVAQRSKSGCWCATSV